MKVFTKHIKVIGVAKHELDALADMIREADTIGKAERRMSETEYLAIEVGDKYDMHYLKAKDRQIPDVKR